MHLVCGNRYFILVQINHYVGEKDKVIFIMSHRNTHAISGEGLIATSRQNVWFTQDLTKSFQEIQENGVTADGRKKILGFIPIWVNLRDKITRWNPKTFLTTFKNNISSERNTCKWAYITCEKNNDGPTVFGMLILLGWKQQPACWKFLPRTRSLKKLSASGSVNVTCHTYPMLIFRERRQTSHRAASVGVEMAPLHLSKTLVDSFVDGPRRMHTPHVQCTANVAAIIVARQTRESPNYTRYCI